MGFMTETQWNYVRTRINLIFPLLITCVTATAQYTHIDSIKIDNAKHLAIDRLNNIYVGDDFGNVFRFSDDLKLSNEFSPDRKGNIAVLDPWNPLKIFLNYSDLQEVIFLDRFLINANRYKLNDISSFIGLCTPSLDNNLWMVDYSSFSLKKYNLTFNQVEIEQPFDLLLDPNNYTITHIREYQNLVFISDSNSGILIFDNLGNYLYKIKGVGIEYFSFKNNKLIYCLEEKAYYVDIYSNEEVIKIIPGNVNRVVETNKFTFFLSNNWLIRAKKQ